MINILIATLILAGFGLLIGLLMTYLNKVLYVEIDSRIETVTEMLPSINCGGCGYPGCSAFAEAVVKGQAEKLSLCRPAKKDVLENILDYLNNAPNPDGSKSTSKI